MAGQGRDNALDHVVVVVFENRSLDNVLGRLHGPGDGRTFEGVTGKELTNPIPDWAEHGADRKVVPYTVATDMDSPNPDAGEEYPHTNTQLFGILSEENRFKLGEEISAPSTLPNQARRRRRTASSPTTSPYSAASPAGSACLITGFAKCCRRRSPTGRSGPPRPLPEW